MTAFPHLFSPIQIGSVTVKNRILSSGHDTVMAEDGKIGDRLVAYHEARAEGGVGLIVAQVAGVHSDRQVLGEHLDGRHRRLHPRLPRASPDASMPHGTVLFGQLFHDGREMMESQDGSLSVALAPSAVPTERFHVMPRAMPVPLIEEIVAVLRFSRPAVQAAGLDGVEIVASHGYLPAQFLNPRVNVRDRPYGGSPENRLRFLREVIASVRDQVGRDFVVGIRISARRRPMTDSRSTSAGRPTRPGRGRRDRLRQRRRRHVGHAYRLGPHRAADELRPGLRRADVREGQAVVSVPVMVAGRINQPQEGEQVLANGQADMVVMTRALICDPLMPAKAEQGLADEIRACIGCNQACIGHFHAGYPISCIQHPETGRERTYGIRRPASAAKDVMVVGGGVGGLKAAVVAAERGHRVTRL